MAGVAVADQWCPHGRRGSCGQCDLEILTAYAKSPEVAAFEAVKATPKKLVQGKCFCNGSAQVYIDQPGSDTLECVECPFCGKDSKDVMRELGKRVTAKSAAELSEQRKITFEED